jgi:hypothetical protein
LPPESNKKEQVVENSTCSVIIEEPAAYGPMKEFYFYAKKQPVQIGPAAVLMSALPYFPRGLPPKYLRH